MLSQPCRSCSCVVSCHVFMKLFHEQIKWWVTSTWHQYWNINLDSSEDGTSQMPIHPLRPFWIPLPPVLWKTSLSWVKHQQYCLYYSTNVYTCMHGTVVQLRPLCFARVLSSSEVTTRNSTKLCHVFANGPDLKKDVKFGGSLPWNVGDSSCLFSCVFLQRYIAWISSEGTWYKEGENI